MRNILRSNALALPSRRSIERELRRCDPLFSAERIEQIGVAAFLEEVRLGDWAAGEFRRRAMVADPEWVAWRRTRRWDGIPGAEGDLVFRTRVTAAVDEIARRHPNQTTAIVVHGGVINAYIAQVLEIPHSLWLTVENTSSKEITRVSWCRPPCCGGSASPCPATTRAGRWRRRSPACPVPCRERKQPVHSDFGPGFGPAWSLTR